MSDEKKRRKRKSLSFSDVIITLTLLIGTGLLLYPTVSNKWNEMYQSKVITGYAQAVSNLSVPDYTATITAATQYNESLIENSVPAEDESSRYNELLNVQGNGIMGYIEIPTIKVRLALYHGTHEAILQVAAGHIEGSSLPVGGPNTHAVISGHRGLTSATLFTHLDKLSVGDEFFIYVLNETLRYRVVNINIVLPDEMELLDIQEGKDLCTLITCTPYGVNSHRLFIQGERVELEGPAPKDPTPTEPAFDEVQTKTQGSDAPTNAIQMVILAAFIGIVSLVILLIIIICSNNSKNSQEER